MLDYTFCGDKLLTLTSIFTRREPLTGITEFDYFKYSYNKFKQESEEWLLEQLKIKQEKDEKLSDMLRTQGNFYFQKKKYYDSLTYYTKSLCYANRNSVNYGLALANRSAALYYIGDFENCLKNIEYCLKSAYPKKLYPKILLRKCYCLYRLKGEDSDELKDCIGSTLSFIRNCGEISSKEKGTHEKRFEHLDFKKVPPLPQNLNLNINDIEIPSVTNGENENFASASSLVGLRYEESRGRHVVATENIKRGDVLFVEKAFVHALISTTKSDKIFAQKCCYCLKDARASIPCPKCTFCVFCNEDCFQNSWQTIHKYECLGVQADIWYELFRSYLPFKAICLGIHSKFAEVKSDDITRFGRKEDNYPYFNSLLSHWRYSHALDRSCKSACKIIAYLKQCTTFFDDLPSGIDVNYIGGLFIRHFCQVECNSIVIQHLNYNDTPEAIPKGLLPVASAIFPSISLMNHSCLPNINIFYVGDTAIVKALKDIKKNEEVLHCYDIDYRVVPTEYRKRIYKEKYNFSCSCILCIGPNPIGDQVDRDVYKCLQCGWSFFDLPQLFHICPYCGGPLQITLYILNKAIRSLEDSMAKDTVLSLDIILRNKKIGEQFYTKLHPFYAMLYEAFWKYYIQAGDFNNAIRYIKLFVEEQTTIVGEPQRAATSLLRALKRMHTYAQKKKLSLMPFEDEIKALMKHCVTVLQLYYPFSQSAIYRCMTT